MIMNRREFVEATGYAALGAALASKLSGTVQAPPGTNFDIEQSFAEFMKMLGQSPTDGGGAVTFVGSDPILRSRIRIATSMALPAMAAGVGVRLYGGSERGRGRTSKSIFARRFTIPIR